MCRIRGTDTGILEEEVTTVNQDGDNVRIALQIRNLPAFPGQTAQGLGASAARFEFTVHVVREQHKDLMLFFNRLCRDAEGDK